MKVITWQPHTIAATSDYHPQGFKDLLVVNEERCGRLYEAAMGDVH